MPVQHPGCYQRQTARTQGYSTDGILPDRFPHDDEGGRVEAESLLNDGAGVDQTRQRLKRAVRAEVEAIGLASDALLDRRRRASR